MRDKLFVISQTGVGHLSADTSRSFSPCQDAYKIVDFPGVEVPDWDGSFSGTIIAVADGHGDPVYHGSSEFGSKLAVEAAVDCMLELLKGYVGKWELCLSSLKGLDTLPNLNFQLTDALIGNNQEITRATSWVKELYLTLTIEQQE